MPSASQKSFRRAPLGEATERVNNSQPKMSAPSRKRSSVPERNSSGLPYDALAVPSPLQYSSAKASSSSAAKSRLSELINVDERDSKRDSQASNTSSNSAGRIKQMVGPWRLGRTLGYGSTARVRYGKHIKTQQEGAVKIILKQNTKLAQAGSLADIENYEMDLPQDKGFRRMPISIEREVAIMKLIKHPHIMDLYDIWENRTEIYMVLEYMENGELFDLISVNGRLHEEEGMKYFRQIISAIGYCHSFNICHRDLKPENILVTKSGDIKIADFGMAALQQGPDYRLKTSCGSPHYAAPEVVKGVKYRGNQIDVWSMGVILFAMLVGRLPFDVPGKGIGPLTAVIRSGKYEKDAPELSARAAHLISRMLTVNPKERITITQIWRHPLIQDYDYLDELGQGKLPQSPGTQMFDHPVRKRSDICQDIIRQLRSMWHSMSEEQLIQALLNDDANDQKLFYSLLVRDREEQLENYTPDFDYSNSDYHHIRPARLTKTYSTMNFPSNKSQGHARSSSKFTVISNAAETERSYDPFKASKPQRLNAGSRGSRAGAKVTIHRNDETYDQEESSAPPLPSYYSAKHLRVSRRSGTRSSIASSVKSNGSSSYLRSAPRYKRGVSFNRHHSSTTSIGSPGPAIRHRHHSSYTEVTDAGGEVLRAKISPSAEYIRSRKAQDGSINAANPAKKRSSLLWGEDVRKLSNNLAKDCDEAFNGISGKAEVDIPPRISSRPKHNSLENRPLPPAPARTESLKVELAQQKHQYELRKTLESPSAHGHLNRMVTHIDDLMRSPDSVTDKQRISSAPIASRKKSMPLSSINEVGLDSSHVSREQPSRYRRGDGKSGRIASAPEPRDTNRSTRGNSDYKDTIRVVSSSTKTTTVKQFAPLLARKKSSAYFTNSTAHDSESEWESSYGDFDQRSRTSRHNYTIDSAEVRDNLAPIAEDYDDEEGFQDVTDQSNGTVVKKKSSVAWFKRISRGSDEGSGSDTTLTLHHSRKVSHDSKKGVSPGLPKEPVITLQPQAVTEKKKSIFEKLFKKKLKADDMVVSGVDVYEDEESLEQSMANIRKAYRGFTDGEDAEGRQIAPRQSWLAKVFKVKPAVRYLCFSVSQRRARKEIVTVFKDWKKYGMRDIQLDKKRNIVFAKVGAKNYLDIKEVSIAAEVMTVIEHGKRSHLSIVRFTQELGAASSFNKVLDTLENVMYVKQMLVLDPLKTKRMIKTLVSSPDI